MTISKIKILWKLLTGGVGKVADYFLDLINVALSKLDTSKKDRIQAVLNLAQQILAFLKLLQSLCPTRWQTAYIEMVEAVQAVVDALADLKITEEEFSKVKKEFEEAVAAWKAPDDDTCKDCTDIDKDCPHCNPEVA